VSNLFKPPSNVPPQTPATPPPTPDRAPDDGRRDPPSPADRHGSWKHADDVAIEALDGINPFSVRDNVEYAGLIYQRGPNDFDFSGPHRGTAGESDPYTTLAPPGTVTVGAYHTHGDYTIIGKDQNNKNTYTTTNNPKSDTGGGDRFATKDYESHRNMGGANPRYTSYLGTPSGAYLSWNPFIPRPRPLPPDLDHACNWSNAPASAASVPPSWHSASDATRRGRGRTRPSGNPTGTGIKGTGRLQGLQHLPRNGGGAGRRIHDGFAERRGRAPNL